MWGQQHQGDIPIPRISLFCKQYGNMIKWNDKRNTNVKRKESLVISPLSIIFFILNQVPWRIKFHCQVKVVNNFKLSINYVSWVLLDCEQTLFFFRFSNSSSLSRLAPSVTRMVICVSRAFCSTDQEKRETARSLEFCGILKPVFWDSPCGQNIYSRYRANL